VLHLLVAALLAAEGRVPSVHEDVAVAGQRFGAERARVQRGQAGLPDRLGVEEESGTGERSGHGLLRFWVVPWWCGGGRLYKAE